MSFVFAMTTQWKLGSVIFGNVYLASGVAKKINADREKSIIIKKKKRIILVKRLSVRERVCAPTQR